MIDTLSIFSCPNTSIAIACKRGTYVSADRSSCEPCIVGTYCPIDKLDAPIVCTNGTYQNNTGQQACIDCPAGQKCPSVSSTPVDCPNGTYSGLGTAECLTCPSGHRLVDLTLRWTVTRVSTLYLFYKEAERFDILIQFVYNFRICRHNSDRSLNS